MFGLGPHASFIVAAYGITFVGLAALIVATVMDDRRQRRRIAQLEVQGIKRRAAASAQSARGASSPRLKKTPA